MATILGFSFPFRKGATKLPEQATDDDVIKQSLIQLLGTVRGERQMRPDYGVDIISKIFEANTPGLADLIRYDVTTAVAKYEPRAVIQQINVVRDEDAGLISLEIQYVSMVTRTLQQLVLTFPVPLGG